jgi:hypothetical protein
MICLQDNTVRGEKRGRTNENMNTTELHGAEKHKSEVTLWWKIVLKSSA